MSTSLRLKSILSCCMAGLCLIGMTAEATPLVLRFATYASERPSEEFKKMEPFRLHLEQALTERGIPVTIRMRIFPTYEDAVDAVADGETDFARLGPANYTIARKQNPGIKMLAMESRNGEKSFNGVILVAKDSPIQTLSDLRGKRFAFGEANSTSGRYLAQEALMQAGITGRDLAEYSFVGRHDKVALAVAAGDYDAGACNDTTLEKYAQAKGLRKLVSFSSPTHAWVARAGLNRRLVEELKKALFAMKGKELEYIGRDGFLPAGDRDYDSLRRSMRKAKAFDD